MEMITERYGLSNCKFEVSKFIYCGSRGRNVCREIYWGDL